MNALVAQTRLIIRNDLRLLWREMRTHRLGAMFRSLGLWIAFFGFLNLVSIAIFAMTHPAMPLVVETGVWWFFAFFMLGAAMNYAVSVLFERADFDLLLSSPVSPRAILFARICGIGISAAGAVLMFIVPLLNGVIIGVSRHYLAGYLVWFLFAAAVAATGVCFTLLLVHFLGPRRARTWSQAIAAFLGALIYLTTQAPNMVAHAHQAAVSHAISTLFQLPALAIVARAGRAEPVPFLIVLAVAVLLVGLTLRLLGRMFVTGIQGGGEFFNRRREIGAFRFSSHLGYATFRKDLKLIARDPVLLARIMPTLFYLVPMMASGRFLGSGGLPGSFAIVGAIGCLMLSASLVRVAAHGEEGWDLIRMSPVSTLHLRIAKIAAGAALPFSVCFACAIVASSLGRPDLGALSVVLGLVSTAGAGWIEVAAIRPTPRKDLLRRHSSGAGTPGGALKLLAALVNMSTIIGSISLAATHHWLWALIPLGIVLSFSAGCLVFVRMEDIESVLVARFFENAPTQANNG